MLVTDRDSAALEAEAHAADAGSEDAASGGDEQVRADASAARGDGTQQSVGHLSPTGAARRVKSLAAATCDASRAVGKLFMVAAGALPVPIKTGSTTASHPPWLRALTATGWG